MNILVDNGSPQLRNIGDMAMLQAAVKRLRELWPAATIHVMATSAQRLGELVPGTVRLSPAGRSLLCRVGTHWAKNPSEGGGALTARLRRRWPAGAHWYARHRLKSARRPTDEMDEFMTTLKSCDLLVAAGGGYINDSFGWVAQEVLETLRMARRMKIPSAVMGQGLGPLASQSMRRVASDALGDVVVLALRERLEGMKLARELGVDEGKIVVTGDDALELTDGIEAAEGRSDIGVNVRVANYAGVDSELVAGLAPGLSRAAGRLGGRLVSLPVAAHEFDNDARAIGALIGNDTNTPVETVSEFLSRVARCRVVVTGSYHAGVFALALGIPVVGIANNAYYLAKFQGLADMFGAGCELLLLDQAEPARLLDAAIGRAWEIAPSVSPDLRQAARRQLEAGREAYRRIYRKLSAGP